MKLPLDRNMTLAADMKASAARVVSRKLDITTT